MIRPLAIPALVTVATTLVGCGGTEIDADKTEALIRQNVTGPAPREVDCPEGVEAKAGDSFECRLTYEDDVPPATVTVHIVDDDGRVRVGPGDFRFRP